MSDHDIVVADRGHLRIFLEQKSPEQMASALSDVDAWDFPDGRKSYVDKEFDVAGRFQGSKQQGRGSRGPRPRAPFAV